MRASSYARDMAKRTRDSTLPKVGRHLRLLRVAFGQSQQDWADALQITPTQLNKWEQGTRKPRIDVLIRICGSTRCTLDFIFRGYLGWDLDHELRDRLAALAAAASVVLVFPEPPPQSPGQLTLPSSVKRRPHRISSTAQTTADPQRASPRQSPPKPRGRPSRP